MLEFPDVDYPQKKKNKTFFSHSKSSIFFNKNDCNERPHELKL